MNYLEVHSIINKLAFEFDYKKEFMLKVYITTGETLKTS